MALLRLETPAAPDLLFVCAMCCLQDEPEQQQQQQQQQPEQDQQQQQQQQGRSIHHMDPYRLGTTDKMAGLIDFEAALQTDVCVIEWPSRMPDSVMQLPRR
jgi:hypothetical protein